MDKPPFPEDHPPPYTSATGRSPPEPQPTPGLPDLAYTKYPIRNSTLSKDRTEAVTTNAALNSDPAALARFLRDQASLPPLPCVRLVGSCAAAEAHGKRVDFDVRVNMLRYFLPPVGEAGARWNYVRLAREERARFAAGGRILSSSSPRLLVVGKSLEDWAERYCKDNTAFKTLTLTRETPNWNTSFVEGQIRTLIASTGYAGQVSVSFPVQYANVTVQPPRGLWTTVFSPLMEKRRYEVVTAVWPYASLPPGSEGRVCAVQTEEWWEVWRGVLRGAVLEGRKGWVSVDDLLVWKMGAGS